MFTNFALIGRVVNTPDQHTLKIEVERSFPEKEGNYKCDCLELRIWRGMQKEILCSCHKGSIIGAKGRIETQKEPYKLILIAEHIRILQI